MSQKFNYPNLLYAIVDGVSETRIKEIFGQRRIRIDFADERPEWAKGLRGAVVIVQTLAGEYGGSVGCQPSDEIRTSQKRSQRWFALAQDNLNKMLAIIKELASEGSLTLTLLLCDAPSRKKLPRQVMSPDSLTADRLYSLPPNTIVIFKRL
jgi:hypothetical protein